MSEIQVNPSTALRVKVERSRDFKKIIEQIQLNFAEQEPSQAYFDCEEEYGEIEGSNPIWRLVEEAIAYAVEQTIDQLSEDKIDA